MLPVLQRARLSLCRRSRFPTWSAKLQPENKAEDLIGGEGMQTRVAVQHDKSRPTAVAELHDASDDVYYVLEGTATLTLGGRLDAPHEIEPGSGAVRKSMAARHFK